MTGIEPGWYKDPADPVTQRYWDGGGWLGDPIPADATPPDGPPPQQPPAAAAPPGTAIPTTPGTGHADPAHPIGTPGAIGAPQPPGSTPPGSTPPGSTTTGSPPPGPGQPPPGWTGTPPPGWTGTSPPGWTAPPPPGWPYPPPPGWVPPLPRPHGYTLAAYPARLVARIIDGLAVLGLNVVVNSWFVWQYVQEITPALRNAQGNAFDFSRQSSAREQYLIYTILIIATALWMAYEVPALGTTGQTLGKRIMQIKVVPIEKDQPLGYGRAFRRWGRLGLWTPLWACCIGFIFQVVDSMSMLWDKPLRQAFHDKAARTVVIQLPPPAARGDAGARTDAPHRPDAGDNPTGGPR